MQLSQFHNFSIAQNLHEIDFGEFRSAKSTILTHYLRGSEIRFLGVFFQFLKAEIYQKQTSEPLLQSNCKKWHF